MFGKKKVNTNTMADERIIKKDNEIGEARKYLCAAVEKVIITTGVINLYPDGPDQEAAIKKAAHARHSLLCRIGAYDGLMQEYNEMLANPKGRLNTIGWVNNRCTSHELVEYTYKDFYKRG